MDEHGLGYFIGFAIGAGVGIVGYFGLFLLTAAAILEAFRRLRP